MKYVKYEDSEIGRNLNQARIDFVLNHLDRDIPQHVVDIGVGSGTFVRGMKEAVKDDLVFIYGYDVNPMAIQMLKEAGDWYEPMKVKDEIVSFCFWDSLEHIENPTPILNAITGHCFVSMPIYKNAEHVLESKHFRKDEHFWYFTEAGFIQFMHLHGFRTLDVRNFESVLGRDAILSFAFERD